MYRVDKLTKLQLDWLVAKLERVHDDWLIPSNFMVEHDIGGMNYSSNILQAQPIIDREKIMTAHLNDDLSKPCVWNARHFHTTAQHQERLVAVMMCYVVSKLGNMVDLPHSLNAKCWRK